MFVATVIVMKYGRVHVRVNVYICMRHENFCFTAIGELDIHINM